MSIEIKNKIVPKLRFPEFKDSGEWEEKSLKKLGQLINGLTYSPDDVVEDGLLVLRSSNIKNGQIVLNDNVYVRRDVKGANLSEPNDILICVRNGSKALIGKNAIIPEGMCICTHGAFMTVFRSNIPKFVFQLFQTSTYERQVAGDLGATINSINGSKFLKYKFFVPTSLAEQQKIASCLSSLDEYITAESEKLEVLKTHKKGLMQQLFPAEGERVPKLRFPEFRDSGEWEEDVLEGKGIALFVNEKMPLDELGLEYYVSTENLLSEYGSKTISSKLPSSGSVTRYRKNDILLSNIRPYLKKVWFANIDGGASNDVIVIRADYKLEASFLSLLLKNDEFINYIMKGAEGVKMPRGDKDLIKLYRIGFPKKDEQQKIASCLSSLDDLINAQTEKIEALKMHKKGLMQGLFPLGI